MRKAFDVIVIGLGAMSASACYHLARRNLAVLGLDQHSLAHDRGSSQGETRLIRKAYFEKPDYVPLLCRAFELWTQLESEWGEALFERNGLVTFGRPGLSRVYEGTLSSGRMYSILTETLSRDQAALRWPMYLAPEGFATAYEPGAGFLHAERCVLAHAEEARKRGAVLRENEAVIEYSFTKGRFDVRTSPGRYSAARLIVAGGGWSSRLLANLGLPLELRKMFVGWFPAPQEHSAKRGAPGFVFDLDEDFYYGFPSIDEKSIKVGGHHHFEALLRPRRQGPVSPG